MNVAETLKSLTTAEKAGLGSGIDMWCTKEIPEKNVPSIRTSDGPNGLRKMETNADGLGRDQSVEAICFPTASCLASSFDRDMIREVGQALGEECQTEGVSVLLGPGVNMKRSPLCGRNFEYYSEDPYLAGEIGTAMTNGVQSQGVGVCIKHFAANNQEKNRFSISVEADMRTLHEIYLRAFEKIVKTAKPWTVMCSYNMINGVYSCENKWLLTDTLRKRWGFDGAVITDWGAMNDRSKACEAGTDLEMPSSHGVRDKYLADAVDSGKLDSKYLDANAERLLKLIDRAISEREEYKKAHGGIPVYSKEEHHRIAEKAAEGSAVLLKNDGGLLPLEKDRKVLFIGEFAEESRYQGGGSSHINTYKVEKILDSADKAGIQYDYVKGFHVYPEEFDDNEEIFNEALSKAGRYDTAVIFAGLSDLEESEGFDRDDIELPEYQNKLISAVCDKLNNVAVVLFTGSPVAFPWKDKVSSILNMYLAGEAMGTALINILYGNVSPSGHLAETFPCRIQDTPAYLNFPGSRDNVAYAEGVYIGYRYYDKRDMDVLFPFGHGLTYTTFEYSDIRVNGMDPLALKKAEINGKSPVTVSLTIKNTGNFDAAEVPQIYVQNAPAYEGRPIKELKGFTKVFLKKGESKTVDIILDDQAFAYFEPKTDDWFVTPGQYTILAGSSSRDIRLSADINIDSDDRIPFKAGDTTTAMDIQKYYTGDPAPLKAFLEKAGFTQGLSGDVDAEQSSMGKAGARMDQAMYEDTPLHSVVSFAKDIDLQDVEDTIRKLNGENNF
ncbi:MAG: glycoside hydrolase family 3 C-terminal domain-containing protein [Lachnospiraceae bacterium]|jgi:beta-glucosidase|nr:glycoside hydrolase family 3 C-terminal domain-containing protein [Lachnospiraceae bacterium]